MPKLIKLQDTYGDIIYINPEHIVCIRPDVYKQKNGLSPVIPGLEDGDSYTHIVLSNFTFQVKGLYLNILQKIENKLDNGFTLSGEL